jgi:hypothetical protein
MLRRNFDFIAVLCVLVGLVAVSDARRFEREMRSQPIRVENIARNAEHAPCTVGRLLNRLALAFSN